MANVVWISRHKLHKVQRVHFQNLFGRNVVITETQKRFLDPRDCWRVIQGYLNEGIHVAQIAAIAERFKKPLLKLSDQHPGQVILLADIPYRETPTRIVSTMRMVKPDGLVPVKHQVITESNKQQKAKRERYVNVPFAYQM